MIHLFKSAALKIWATTLVLVVSLGIVVAVARLLLPLVEDYRGEIEKLLSEQTGLDLRIGGVTARLYGLAPEFVLTDVAVRDPNNQAVQIQVAEIGVDFNIARSLVSGRLITQNATIAGARLAMTRLPDGSLSVTGLQGIEETGASGGDTQWFFLAVDDLRIIDSEVTWHDEKTGAEPVQFSDVQILFRNKGDHHRSHASARIANLQDAWIHIINDIHGNPAKLHTVAGNFYIKGEHLALDRLFGAYGFGDVRIESGAGDIELWARMTQGNIESVHGTVDLRRLSVPRYKRADTDPISGLAAIEAGIAWQRQPDGWRLDVEDLAFSRSEKTWPTTGFSLHVSGAADKRLSLRAGFEFLRVQDLVAIGQPFFPATTEFARVLSAVDIRAELHGLQIVLDQRETGVAWSAKGRVSELEAEAWQDFPGVSGLDLRFWVDQDQGTAELESQNASVRFPGLFRDPLRAAELSGRAHWRWRPDGTLVAEAPNLKAHNIDISTQTRVRLLLPPDDESAFLDLQTDFQGGSAGAVPGYLPVSIMSEGLVDWLDRAFVSGRIESGSALVHGRLNDFPFKNDEGRFEVRFGVRDLILEYMEDWPRLEDVVSEIRFLNEGLSFRLTQGEVLASSISRAEGQISDLKRTSPLKLQATLNGPLSDYVRVLSEPPLSLEFGDYVKDLRLSGQARTQLDLSIPIDDGSPLEVKGKLGFNDASLTHTSPDIRLSALQGNLEFTQDGVWCSGVRGQAFDIPIVLDVDTIAGNSNRGGITRITARGVVPVSELARRYPGVGFQYLEGTGKVELRSDIGHRSAIERLAAKVDLTRVAVNLPPPLGKVAGKGSRLTVATELSDRPAQQIDVKYGDDISAALVFARKAGKDMSLERGVIRFGSRSAQPRHGRGFWLEGSLDVLDADAWSEWSARQAVQDRTAGSWDALLKGIDLEAGELVLNGKTFRNVDMDILRTDQAWTGYVGTAMLAGNLYLPHDFDAGPLVAKLEYLDLPAFAGENGEPVQKGAEEAAQATSASGGYDPGELPALDLSIKELRVDGKAIGQAALKAERIPTGLHMSTLSVDGPNLTLKGNGHWIVTEDTQVTELILVLESEEVGKLLEDLGYQNLVKDAPTQVDVAFRWPGAPQAFALASVAGTLNIKTGKGRLLDVGPGVGRVFGLVNFGALQRRLSLDFSDLFGKGFGFDEIKAGFLLKDGNANTDDAHIEGPAARIDMSGRTGLVARDYDQKVVVTPRVSGSIPVAGVLAGGPALGAVLLVAQQLLGKEVDRLTRYQYAVTGSWEDPVFTREKSDGSWSLSRIFGADDKDEVDKEDEENAEIGGGYLDH